MKSCLLNITRAALVGLLLAAQATAQTAQPAAQTPAPQRRATPRPAGLQVIVRDVSGSPLAGVKVTASGAVSQEVVTDDKGTATVSPLRDGTYRLRFERDGFVTVERDVAVRSGQPAEVYAAMRISSVQPAPAAAPPPPTAPLPPPPVAAAPIEPPVFVSIPSFLDKNLVRRGPPKESLMGCLADSTTRLLQLPDALSEHTHSTVDEILYVVAGQGTVRLKNDSSDIEPGSLSIIPRGVAHAIDRRGKNPLILVSVLSGEPCRAGQTSQAAAGSKK